MCLAATKMRVARLPSEIHPLMRAELNLAASICLATANGQVINGSFEDSGQPSFAGWNMACGCSVPTSSDVVPGGTGDWSLRMNSSDIECICSISGFNRQAVPWLTPGPWSLSAWIKGVGPDGFDGTRVMLLSSLDPFSSIPALAQISTVDSVWAYRNVDFTVPMDVDPDSLFLVLFADGAFNDVRPVYFDDIQLSPDISTTIAEGPEPITFRPNPTTDMLWVDQREIPLDIVGIDASGRLYELGNFTYRDRTLEVDVRTLPAGICILRVTTASASHTIRFLKT